MNVTTSPTILLNLASMFVSHQRYTDSVCLIQRLDEYFHFDHHIFLMDLATDPSFWFPMSCSNVTSVDLTPQTIYSIDDFKPSNVKLTTQKTKLGKYQLLVLVVERLAIENRTQYFTQIETVRRLDMSVKIGVFILESVTSLDSVEQLFRWSWNVGIVNIFCAFHWKAANGRPFFNVFKYSPFGKFHLTNLTHSEYGEYFIDQNRIPNFHRHPIQFLKVNEIYTPLLEIELWRTVLQAFNATKTVTYVGYKEYVSSIIKDVEVCPHETLQSEHMRTTYPHRLSAFALVVPHAKLYSDFAAYLQNGTWAQIFVLTSVVIVTTSFALIVSRWLQKKKLLPFQCFLDVINLLMNDNAGIRYHSLHRADVFVTVPLTFTGLIMMNGIVSLFQSYLTSPIYQRQINSLHDLYTSSVLIAANEIDWKDRFSKMLEEATKYVGWDDKIIGIPLDRLDTEIRAFNNTIAFITFDDVSPVYLKVQSMLDVKAYHVLSDTILARFLNRFEISKTFQFTEQINNIIHRLNSAGLIDKWFKDGMEQFMWKLVEKTHNHPLRIGELSDEGEFYVPTVLRWGWVASSMVFICEIIWGKVKSHKRHTSKGIQTRPGSNSD